MCVFYLFLHVTPKLQNSVIGVVCSSPASFCCAFGFNFYWSHFHGEVVRSSFIYKALLPWTQVTFASFQRRSLLFWPRLGVMRSDHVFSADLVGPCVVSHRSFHEGIFYLFIYFLAEMLTYFNSYSLDKVRFGGSPKRIQQYTVLVFY